MPVELDNEIALVRLAQSGSTESFEILVNRYEQRIYRFVRVVTKNDQDAEDVLHDTFLKAYANIQHFKGESRFYTWLVSVAMNEVLTRLNLRHAHTWISLSEPADTREVRLAQGNIKDWRHNPEAGHARAELTAILSNAIEDLETPLRVVFALRDIERFSDEETASILGLPLAAVTTRLTRARLKLRQNLSVWFENPATAQSGDESVGHFLGAAMAEDRECT